VPIFVSTGKVSTRKHLKWRNWEARFPIEFPSNHTSISFSFGDIRVRQTDGWKDRQTDITVAGPQIVEGQLITVILN